MPTSVFHLSREFISDFGVIVTTVKKNDTGTCTGSTRGGGGEPLEAGTPRNEEKILGAILRWRCCLLFPEQAQNEPLAYFERA